MSTTSLLFARVRRNPSLLWLLTGILYLLSTVLSPPATIAGKIYWPEIGSNLCMILFASSLLALIGSLFFVRKRSFLERFAYLFPVVSLLIVSLFFVLSILYRN